MSARPVVIDYVFLVCKVCGRQDRADIDPPLRGADQLVEWMKTNVRRFCSCPGSTCDVKAHLVEQV